MNQQMQILTSRKTVSWYTPEPYIAMARAVLGDIDLDPASADLPQTWIRAKQYYTLDLSQWQPDPTWSEKRYRLELKRESRRQLALQPIWQGRVFLNSPFDDTPLWTDRLHLEYNARRQIPAAIQLCNSNLGYHWYEKLWRRHTVCCCATRISFIREDGTKGGQSKQGQTFVYYGQDDRAFCEVFSAIGRIIRPGY